VSRDDRTLSLRLFVAGESPDSALAIANLRALFPEHSSSPPEIEIVDVRRQPERAARDRILVTPTLLKIAPAPACRVLGNLKNREALLHLLGIEVPDAEQS
jgi:circadian clock protein KaiB